MRQDPIEFRARPLLLEKLVAWIEARREAARLSRKSPQEREDIGLTLGDVDRLGA